MITAALGWADLEIEPPPEFDVSRARSGLQKKLAEEQAQYQKDTERLKNPEFLSKAPEDEKEKISRRRQDSMARVASLESALHSLPKS
ncbi:MAG TPA: hypothetical protein VJ728_11220 [Candidatus Binataceae bacterium]|nr:hypothetical protein [Candidatus Binataceae bacterium]